MEKIEQLFIPDNSRVIVISDIHGEMDLFRKLLNKVVYSEDDILIINGDLGEKGSDSKEVVRYMMGLSKNSKVYVTEGNCDTLVENLIDEDPKLIDYLIARKYSLLNEWLDELGYSLNEKSTTKEIKELLINHYSEEINWLLGLPTVIETDKYIFVHAGINDGANWQATDRNQAISMPSFLDKNHAADKYVVVGHWPVVNYPSDIPSNNPIINDEKKIIAIDGGNVIKFTGQLNALIIETNPERDTFSYTYVDKFPACKVKKDFNADPKRVGSISYPFYGITPAKASNYFTLCKQEKSNKMLYVKNEYIELVENDNYTVKADVSCAQISVNKGDFISIIDNNCSGYVLIKKEGQLGWIPKTSISEQ